MARVAPISPAGGITKHEGPGGSPSSDLYALTLPRTIRLISTALAMPLRPGNLGRSRPRYGGLVVDPEAIANEAHLRPIERRIRRLVAAGVDPAEVAWRFRRSRRSVSQILALGSRPNRGASSSTNPQVLRPLERRILAWREAGASYAEIGARFRRSPQFVRRVEDLARAKLARAENDDT
jgi:DNA-binding CsgD family transcriptional regulator